MLGWAVRNSASRTYIRSVSSQTEIARRDNFTYELESTNENTGNVDIGEGDSVSNKEGLVGETLLKVSAELEDGCLGGINSGLVVGDFARERTEPSPEVDEKVDVGP